MLSALALSVTDGPVDEGVGTDVAAAAEEDDGDGVEAVFAFVFR